MFLASLVRAWIPDIRIKLVEVAVEVAQLLWEPICVTCKIISYDKDWLNDIF